MIDEKNKGQSGGLRYGNLNRFGESIPDYDDVKDEYSIEEAVFMRNNRLIREMKRSGRSMCEPIACDHREVVTLWNSIENPLTWNWPVSLFSFLSLPSGLSELYYRWPKCVANTCGTGTTWTAQPINDNIMGLIASTQHRTYITFISSWYETERRFLANRQRDTVQVFCVLCILRSTRRQIDSYYWCHKNQRPGKGVVSLLVSNW